MDLPTSRCPWLLCGRSNRAKDRDTAISIVVPAACDFRLLRDIEFRSPATLRPSYSTNGSVKDAINTQTCSWPHATFRGDRAWSFDTTFVVQSIGRLKCFVEH